MAKGHIERLPSGSFRAVVYAGKDPLSGKPAYLRGTSKTEEGAVALLGKLLGEARAGRAPEANATVGHLLGEYLKSADVEHTTRDTYEGYVRRVIRPALGEVEIRKVRGRTIELFYGRLRSCRDLCTAKRGGHECRPLAASTIRQIHAILSGAFAAAARWEWLDRNPAEGVRLPTVRQADPDPPSPAEVARLLEAAWADDPPLAVFLWLAVTSGARRGELCGLRWARLDLGAGTMKLARNYVVRSGRRVEKDTKTHQARTIALDPATCELLAEHRERLRAALAPAGVELPPGAYVFSHDPAGLRPWNPDSTTHRVAQLAKRAGIAATIKSLRHYNATQLLAAGVDLRTTAGRLGHSGGGAITLRVYAHKVAEADQRAAQVLTRQLPRPTP